MLNNVNEQPFHLLAISVLLSLWMNRLKDIADGVPTKMTSMYLHYINKI